MQSWMDADQILQISQARVPGTKHPEKVLEAGLAKVSVFVPPCPVFHKDMHAVTYLGLFSPPDL